MTDRPADDKIVEAFKHLHLAWLMQLQDGWWAYYNDEPPIGPFATQAEAARAGVGAWGEGLKARGERCNQCGQEIMEIDNRGEWLIGCLTCNLWAAANGARWKRLSVEDLRALHRLTRHR